MQYRAFASNFHPLAKREVTDVTNDLQDIILSHFRLDKSNKIKTSQTTNITHLYL